MVGWVTGREGEKEERAGEGERVISFARVRTNERDATSERVKVFVEEKRDYSLAPINSHSFPNSFPNHILIPSSSAVTRTFLLLRTPPSRGGL